MPPSEPPPRPPPHGSQPRPPGGLPDGNYDIFIIPPHSAGSGFLYLPSLQPHRNSFLAGVACTLLAVGVYSLLVPVLRSWLSNVMAGGGGVSVLLVIMGVGVAGWAWGKTQGESDKGPGPGGGSAAGASAGAPPHAHAPPPQTGPAPKPDAGAQSGWEKAREETRKREEERKHAEELKKKREDAQKAKEEAERQAKAKAEKDKWEQARAREKEQRERDARERIARERREKDTREREAREAKEKEASSPSKSGASRYEKPSAKSFHGSEDAHSFRPYDAPPKRPQYKSSASSISGLSESSYAPSQSTARTTPPPSQRGPYHTDEPDKIQLKAVYLFSDSFPNKAQSQLVANQNHVTDGLILRIKTEGLFIDDDVRGVPQREWDVKAWTLKLLEDAAFKTPQGLSLHVLRASTRDAENKRYCFVLDEKEGWKVAIGLGKLRKGSQVRSLGMNGLKDAEIKALLGGLGWM